MFGQFLSELKRRNVVRVAAVYTVTAWAIFQVAKTIFETLGFPKWTSPLVLVLLALGLPIAMVIAWAFERGPDGRVGPTPAADAEAPRVRLNRVDVILLGAMALVLGLSAAQMAGLGRGGMATVLGRGTPDKSVAVLPFTAFSGNSDSEYFADGLTEEVINSLAQVPELKVAGRTSSFYFKGKNEDLREVGKRLGVANLVEGSVRREGDRLRVTAQLVSVKDGYHLWSKTYDRKLVDSLAIQTEIGEAVAQAMKVKLAAQGARPPAGDRRDPAAFQLQLTSQAQLRKQDPESLKAARAGFEKLMELEPQNAAAFAGYAQATMVLAQQQLSLDLSEAERLSQGAIDRAVQLDPKSPDVWLAKAMIARVLSIRVGGPQYEKAFDAAIAQALKLAPNKPEALSVQASRLNDLGKPAQAVAFGRKALAIDPLNRSTMMTLGKALMRVGRMDEAEEDLRSVAELFPDYDQGKYQLAMLLVERGQLDKAVPWLVQAVDGQDPFISFQASWVYENLGMRPQAEAVIRQIQGSPGKELGEAGLYASKGDWAGMLAFGKAMQAKDDEPFWPMVCFQAQMMLGRPQEAMASLKKVRPDILSPEPSVNTLDLALPVLAAHGLRQIGDQAQANLLMNKVLAVTTPAPGHRAPNDWRITRAKVFAELGRNREALAELDAAYQGGWRTGYLFDDGVWLDRQPNMAGLAGDPQFKALMAKVRADLAKQGRAVQAAKA